MLTEEQADLRGMGDNGGPPLVVEFTKPQFELITTQFRFPAMVAGFGAGKTEALVARAMRLKLEFPENDIAYYLPTYDLVDRIAIPRFEEVLASYGMFDGVDFKIYSGKTSMIKVFGCGTIIFRTMDKPGRIIGYEVGDSLVDELDTLKEEDARLVWQKIIARNRQKKPGGADNTIAVGTTPEGFRFVYDRWKRNPPNEQYHIIKASTYSNARNLPDNYIDDLIADYPDNLIAAYLEGEFVNLTSGAVYPEFNRELNRCNSVMGPGEALHIGMDFNVGKMAGVVFVQREGDPHAVAELVGLLDTPAMIDAIKRRFPNHAIFVYPDATGGARKTQNASVSDIALLGQAGFTVLNNASNPAVKDRVLSMNRMIHAGGKRRLRVNTDLCPAFTEGLEKQAYNDKGEPDKTSGFDHVVDGGGYFICYRFPVLNSRVQKVKIGGV
jgi:hypothetical protein